MFENSVLPNEVICNILQQSDIPIDTRLTLKEFIHTRKSLNICPSFKCKLASIYKKRVSNYKKYEIKLKDNGFIWCMRIDESEPVNINDKTYIEFYINDIDSYNDAWNLQNESCDRVIEFHMKITKLNFDDSDYPHLLSVKHIRCNMNSGENIEIYD